MNYLDHHAASSFYFLTLHSYDLRLIGLSELQQRLNCLNDMVEPNDNICELLRWILPQSSAGEPEIINDDQSEILINLEQYSGHELRQAIRRKSLPASPELSLIINNIAGMKKWVFHPFDEDPHPSIPHGHEHGKNHPKCDPYTGKVYDSRSVELVKDRLSRKTRIALWSDPRFREFALKAIIWYQEHHPYYSFRVARPMRLPRFL